MIFLYLSSLKLYNFLSLHFSLSLFLFLRQPYHLWLLNQVLVTLPIFPISMTLLNRLWMLELDWSIPTLTIQRISTSMRRPSCKKKKDLNMDNSLEIVLSLSLSLSPPPPPPRSSYHSHGFAPVDGYQWMGNYLVLVTFPLTNGRGNCITSTPTCIAAFNSTIIMAPVVIPDLSSGYCMGLPLAWNIGSSLQRPRCCHRCHKGGYEDYQRSGDNHWS